MATPPRQGWARTGPRSPQTPSKLWHSHLVQDDEPQVGAMPQRFLPAMSCNKATICSTRSSCQSLRYVLR